MRTIVWFCAAIIAGLAASLPGGAAQAHTSEIGLVMADRVVVLKGERRLDLLHGGRIVRSFHIALGREPTGAKAREGDGRTPEGIYRLDWRNDRSRFHLSIHISYPNSADRKRARLEGVSPGGDIMIHGLPNGLGAIGMDHARWDWTDGCIAVTNAEMDEIWARVADGTPVEIFP